MAQGVQFKQAALVIYNRLPLPLPGDPAMSINQDDSNEDATIARFREELKQMSDADVIRYGRAARKLAHLRGIFRKQLTAAREEWQRRHPPKQRSLEC